MLVCVTVDLHVSTLISVTTYCASARAGETNGVVAIFEKPMEEAGTADRIVK